MNKKQVYFIQPSITYNSRTERYTNDLIKSEIGGDVKIISPSKLSTKRIRKWKEDLKSCDAVVGLALEMKYTISVWTVLEYAEEKKIPVYTVEVDEGGYNWKEGIVEDIEKLSYEETRRFTRDISLGSTSEMVTGLLFGRRSKY
jgi:hypothetical protein